MIVIGASRHAKEILQILEQNQMKTDFLFDDVSKSFDSYFGEYDIIRSIDDEKLKSNDKFVLGLGGTKVRRMLYDKFTNLGITPSSIVSSTSVVGKNFVELGKALNIMHFVFIADNVKIGDGSLINAFASIHHDAIIGSFSEISPRATILGGACVGDYTSIGAGAILLPNVKVGNNCVIGAGAVVTKNIDDNETWYGVPARLIK